jgi:NDP-sugar pyrophosphorylase family protein
MPVPRSALVLAAGLGTRLRPLTLARAKPAIPLAGDPLIRRILRWLASHQVTDIVVNLHYLPETIAAVVGDGSDLSVAVRYSWEQPRVLGSAGGPAQALPLMGGGRFFIVNGDTLTDVDLSRLAAAHQRSGARITLALAPNRQPERYGGVRVDANGRVVGFVSRGSGIESSHFVGVQLVEADVFRSLPPGQPANTVGGLYDNLIRADPAAISTFECGAEFWDVGTEADYWLTSQAFMRAERLGDMVQGRNVRVAASARVTRSILWDDVDVEDDATVDECIVADGVRVTAGSSYRRMVLVSPKNGDSLIVSPRELPRQDG